MAKSENSSESFPELRIEDGVDDRIDTGVDVAQQGGGLEGKVSRWSIQGVFYTEGVKDITSEERNPANKKTCWNRKDE